MCWMSRRSGCTRGIRRRLIDILKSLRDLGNTVLVVEHDPDTIAAADHVIDLGPGAGELGGKLLFRRNLRGDAGRTEVDYREIFDGATCGSPCRTTRHKTTWKIPESFTERTLHNLKNVDVMIPLGMLTVVTGVSGSGKSTLVHDVLYKALAAKRNGGTSIKEFCDADRGTMRRFSEVVIVDQSPIGRTPRSNPATYLKAFDAIREVFADTPDAKRRGYTRGAFFVQRAGRTMRDLPGRRNGDRGDAVSGGRGADLRGVPRDAIQERRAGGAVPREEFMKCCR